MEINLWEIWRDMKQEVRDFWHDLKAEWRQCNCLDCLREECMNKK